MIPALHVCIISSVFTFCCHVLKMFLIIDVNMASTTPHDIKNKNQPTGVEFHPEKPIIAVADIVGQITLYVYICSVLECL